MTLTITKLGRPASVFKVSPILQQLGPIVILQSAGPFDNLGLPKVSFVSLLSSVIFVGGKLMDSDSALTSYIEYF